MRAEVDPRIVMSRMENVNVYTLAASNGSHVALSRHPLSSFVFTEERQTKEAAGDDGTDGHVTDVVRRRGCWVDTGSWRQRDGPPTVHTIHRRSTQRGHHQSLRTSSPTPTRHVSVYIPCMRTHTARNGSKGAGEGQGCHAPS